MALRCGALTSAVIPYPHLFSLADARGPAKVAPQAGVTPVTPTLILSPPHAAAGFDSRHIVYVRQASQLEHYAHNEWVDTRRACSPR
jgi:cholesterol transport system auxiliary component